MSERCHVCAKPDCRRHEGMVHAGSYDRNGIAPGGLDATTINSLLKPYGLRLEVDAWNCQYYARIKDGQEI